MLSMQNLPTLTCVSSRAHPLDDHTRQWVRDLELKGRTLAYLCHPDFQPGYRYGYQFAYDDLANDYVPTHEEVIQTMKNCLSHTHYKKQRASLQTRGRVPHSYPWHVGFLFGWLTGLLQTEAASDFPFLLAPVADMHSYLASRVPASATQNAFLHRQYTSGEGFPLDL